MPLCSFQVRVSVPARLFVRPCDGARFSAAIAEGSHLFPFRTEKLSLPAPMVLQGQPCGRVGRRRICVTKARDSTESRAFVVQTTRTTAGPRASFEHGNPRLAGVAGFAVRRSRGLAGGQARQRWPAAARRGQKRVVVGCGVRNPRFSVRGFCCKPRRGSCDFAWFSDRLW